MTRQPRVQCAICALRCAPGDRVVVDLRLSEGGPQSLVVHWQCLRNALHPDVRLFDVDAYGHGVVDIGGQG